MFLKIGVVREIARSIGELKAKMLETRTSKTKSQGNLLTILEDQALETLRLRSVFGHNVKTSA